MPMQTPKSTFPFDLDNVASSFAMNMLLNAALTETMKVVETMRLEGRQLLSEFKTSEGPAKEKVKTAISLNIQDRKFLLETIFLNVIEKDV